MKKLTDQEVLDIVLKKDGNINGNKVNQKFLNQERLDLKMTLETRYDDIPEDMYTNSEVIYRIINHIDDRPVCKYCGKPVPFMGKAIGFSHHCGFDCLQTHAKDKKTKYHKDIDDDKIISKFISTNGRIITDKLGKYPEVKKYLENRYNDIPENKFSYAEVIYRIKNHIDTRPVCRTCGNPVSYAGREVGFKNHCSNKCITQDKEVKEKIAESCKKISLEKYGVENPYQSEEVKNKIKKTWMEKYGVDNPNKSEKVRNKTKKTCLKRYGTEYAIQSSMIKEKIKQNNLEKLGVEWPVLSKECREKMRQTNIKKYGFSCSLVNEKVKAKAFETKKTKDLLGKSKEEDLLYEIIKELYPDTIHHYRSNEYPHACDFYIPSLDLWIEFQGYGSHNGRLYRGTLQDIEDLEKIKEKAKSSKFYSEIVYVWPNLDVKKYNDAINNNLNFLSIYPKWSTNWSKYYGHLKQEEYFMYKDLAKEDIKSIISRFDIEEHNQNIIGEYYIKR